MHLIGDPQPTGAQRKQTRNEKRMNDFLTDTDTEMAENWATYEEGQHQIASYDSRTGWDTDDLPALRNIDWTLPS